MTIIKKTKIALLVGCFVLSTIAQTGCRTAAFKKPNFEKLAFWKKDGSLAGKNVPPPPARHFDPSPIQQDRVAQEKFEGSELMDLGGRRFNEAFANASNKSDSQVAAGGRTTNQPIRKPYSSDLSAKSNENFSVTANPNAQSNLTGGQQGLSSAQQDFQSAMQSTTISANSPENSFKASAPKSSTSNAWKDFDLPTGLAKKGASSVNSSLKGINNAIYDANGKLASSAKEAKSTFQNKFNDVNNSFKAGTQSAVNKASQFAASTSNSLQSIAQPKTGFNLPSNAQTPATAWNAQASSGFKTPAGLKAPSGFQAQSEATASSGGGSQLASGTSNNDLESVQAQVADAKRQIELLKEQVADAQRIANQSNAQASAQQQLSTAIQPQSQTQTQGASEFQTNGQSSFQTNGQSSFQATNGFQPNAFVQTPNMSSVNQFAMANTQPNNTMRAQATEPNQASQVRVAQSENSNFSNSFASANSGFSGSNPAPSNVLRNDGQAMGNSNSPAATQQFAPTQNPNVAPQSYPSTPHGGYSNQGNVSSNFAPAGVSAPNSMSAQTPQPASQVNFQGNAAASVMNQANTPVANSDGAARIQSHVSDVNIPASILTGSGSYAPGSVHAVSGK